MNGSMRGSLALLFAAVVAGCPYSSRVPLAEPDGNALEDRLIGQWVGVDSNGDSLQIAVFPFNQTEYYAELREPSGDRTGYRAFAFDVGGERLLHINELTTTRTEAEYVLGRCAFAGDSELTLRFIGDQIVPKALAEDPQALSAFLKEHLADPTLNDGDTELALRRSK